MPNSNLILRTLTSPYGDTTLGSVLSHADVDNNFIFLKSKDISTGQLNGQIINLTRVDGTSIDIDLGVFTSGTTSITGGTYDSNTGIITFTNATGGTFQVSGLFKPSDDIYVSGFTFNLGTYDLTIERNDGTNFTQSLGILSSDMTITGGTYNPSNGVATFTNNSGGTFNVSGFLTGYTDTNIYNSDGTLTGNRTVTLNGNNLAFTEDISVAGARVGLGSGQINSNTALGTLALNSNTTGFDNVAIGNQALNLNDTGRYNAAVGSLALAFNITGRESVAVGYQALFLNTTGRANTALGFQALRNNNADFNTAIGPQALQFNSTGTHNIAIGLQPNVYNTIGSYNISVGDQSLYYSTAGTSNIAVGYRSLFQSLGNSGNIAIGDESLTNVNGNNNTSIGYQSGYQSLSGSGNVFLGYQAGFSATGSNLLYIENSDSLNPLIYGDFANDLLRFNGKVGVNVQPTTYQFDVNGTSRFNGDTLFGGSNNYFNLANSHIFYNGTTSGFGLAFAPTNTINATNHNFTAVSVMGSVYGTISYVLGNNTFNNLGITPTINTLGGTNLIRGVYFSPIISGLTGTTIIGFENTIGNNIFNSLSGNTLIGTTGDTGNKLLVSASTDPVRFIGLSGVTTDTSIVTSNSNGTLRTLGGNVANRIPFFNSSSAITTVANFELQTPTGTATLMIPGNGGGATGSALNLNGSRAQLLSSGIGGLNIYVGNGSFGGTLDSSKSIVLSNNGRSFADFTALEGAGSTAQTTTNFYGGVVINPSPTNTVRNFWGTNGANLSVIGKTYTDGNTATSTASDITFTSFGAPTLSALTSGVTYSGISTVYIANAPTKASNVSGNTYALKVANGTTSLGGGLVLNSSLTITSGSNKTVGVVTLTGGTATVVNSLVTSNTIIMLTKQTNTTSASVAVSAKSTGSFTITSSSGSDADNVAYMIINTIE